MAEPPPLPKKPPPLPPKSFKASSVVCTSCGGVENRRCESQHKRPVVPVHPFKGQQSQPEVDEIEHHQNKDKSAPDFDKPPVPPKPVRKTLQSSVVRLRHQPWSSSLANKRESKQTAVLLIDDDESTIRRSRLIAARSGDCQLSHLLLANRQTGVGVFRRSAAVSTNNNDHHTAVVELVPKSQRQLSIKSTSSIVVDLDDEKQELIKSLSEKLNVLERALNDVQDEIDFNEQLGRQVRKSVEESSLSCSQKETYNLHVEDVEKITLLLLKLSNQMAKVENELSGEQVKADPQLQERLTERRNRLADQIKDATCLKQDLDSRTLTIRDLLSKQLDSEILDDFSYYLTMKNQLLLDSKEIDDKIKLGRDQKSALISSLGSQS